VGKAGRGSPTIAGKVAQGRSSLGGSLTPNAEVEGMGSSAKVVKFPKAM